MDGWENGYLILHRPFHSIPSCSTRPRLADREHQDKTGPVWFLGWCWVVSLGWNVSWMDGSTLANDITLPKCTLVGVMLVGGCQKCGYKNGWKGENKEQTQVAECAESKIETNSQFESHQPKMKTKRPARQHASGRAKQNAASQTATQVDLIHWIKSMNVCGM